VLTAVGVTVCGRAHSADDALALVENLEPDVLVIGLELREDKLEVWECLRRARVAYPELRQIVVSAHAEPETIDRAFAEGASAFCLKSAQPDDFAAAIRQSFEHSIYLAHVPTALDSWREPLGPAPSDAPLTRRELEILRLVAEGHSNSEVARMLWVTEQTVKFHLSNIYRKLNVTNRTEASRWAQLHGLLQQSQPRVA
jgi:DNA-binding NarL/FixJ family response regulator